MEDTSSEVCTRDTDTEPTSAQEDSDNMEETTLVIVTVDLVATVETALVDTEEMMETVLEATKATLVEVETLEDKVETTFQDQAAVQAADQV